MAAGVAGLAGAVMGATGARDTAGAAGLAMGAFKPTGLGFAAAIGVPMTGAGTFGTVADIGDDICTLAGLGNGAPPWA